MNKTYHISRRAFVRRCSAIAAATGLPIWFVKQQVASAESDKSKIKSPNDRPRLALIGSGGMGAGGAKSCMRFADVVAVCDVDQAQIDKRISRFIVGGKKPDTYRDFRKLLERDDIDCIVNGTPDHWHSLINIAAARAGKDIYSEKPLTLTIDEGRHVIKAVRDNQRVLQTGTQQRSSKRFRLACELVRNGRIGKLKEVNVWLPAGLREGQVGGDPSKHTKAPFQPQPIPETLDWDFWQGQAEANDYMFERCHTWFRYWYEYSGGTMTDWGAHHMDIGYWAIGLPAPTQIESKALSQPIPGGYSVIADYEVKFTYPNGVIFNVRSTRDDNPFGGIVNKDGQRNGIRFEGTDGWIWVNRGSIEASDRDLLRTPLPDDAEKLYESSDHRKNFFDCMLSREDPICNVETGHLSAVVCHLGAISLRTGKNLTWDPDGEIFTGPGSTAANAHIAREMRAPYNYDFIA
ncbi:oxidoreductase [Coraliomargarita sinensis]|uniref:Oxidoreductase n=1 Tax=Coraliomargarita sinensis TaxID=2174842 RepID=A0A317ZGK1_9BACT|nr:Gfo/Idh/MocA family oxidoreductase [Coraliomargarita sinensis]PXA03353.1 oxidoreductase [Coraliomargarita sinensis]